MQSNFKINKMDRLKNEPKKSFIVKLKERKDYDSVKTFQEPIDLFFPLMWSIVLNAEKKK